jgi:hypothetical protein
MATKTRNDLVNQALTNLGVLASGQTASSEDFDAVDNHVDTTLAELDAEDIVTIDDDDEIPAEWFEPIAVLVADNAALAFGLPGVPASPSSPDPVGAAKDKLRVRTRGKPTGQPLRIDYF